MPDATHDAAPRMAQSGDLGRPALVPVPLADQVTFVRRQLATLAGEKMRAEQFGARHRAGGRRTPEVIEAEMVIQRAIVRTLEFLARHQAAFRAVIRASEEAES